jgi:hypothetical protein
MRIGRLQFGLTKYNAGRKLSDWLELSYSDWSDMCGCRILSVSLAYFTWLSRTCRCSKCNNYECLCEPEPDEKSYGPDDRDDD